MRRCKNTTIDFEMAYLVSVNLSSCKVASMNVNSTHGKIKQIYMDFIILQKSIKSNKLNPYKMLKT